MERNKEELREAIRRAGIEAGADLVGFADSSRFPGGELQKILPTAKSVIGVLFRVLRGSYRGIEEGTTYYQYTTTGVETIEETLIPGALLRIAAAVEDGGYLAVPQKKNQMLRADPDEAHPEMIHQTFYPAGAREPQLDFTAAAVACGFGEIGRSGALLTDDFGPFQRVAFLVTDAGLEPDPIVSPHLCDGCGACVAACPGHAIGENGVDGWQCAAYYRGANRRTNPYMPPDALEGIPDRERIMGGEADLSKDEALRVMEELTFYPPVKHGYVASICGRACDRACYAHLEEKGVLKRSFVHKLRIRPAWELPLEGDGSDPTPWDEGKE